MKILKKLACATMVSLLASSVLAASSSITLQNMERERAALLETLTSGQLDSGQRQAKVDSIFRRLADAERMVIRDDRIAAQKTVLARKAFSNYDLTFLVHASTEKHQQPLAHWLTALDISSDAVLSTTAGKRQ